MAISISWAETLAFACACKVRVFVLATTGKALNIFITLSCVNLLQGENEIFTEQVLPVKFTFSSEEHPTNELVIEVTPEKSPKVKFSSFT